MDLLERVHQQWILERRIRALARVLAPLISSSARVLDIGCGDGRVATEVAARRPDLTWTGIDVLVRPAGLIPVRAFDGGEIPFEDRSFDDVLFVDVLHHAENAGRLLDEAKRVARRTIIIKDHLLEGWLAGPTLRWMDRVGNSRHGVALPYNYWTREKWRREFEARGLSPCEYSEQVGLYPIPADWIFGRHLHFVARIEVG